MTWKVVEEAACLSKKPTSCLRTDFRYSILMRDVCLSDVLVQQIPSAKNECTQVQYEEYEMLVIQHLSSPYVADTIC